MAADRRLLWVISYHHAANDGTLLALVALLPILMDEMALSYAQIGLLGLGLIITVIVQLMVGRVADRMFSKYLLEAGAALMAASFVLLLWVSDFTGLFLAVISMRVGASFYHPVGISWITREYEGPYLDTALGIQSGTGNLGVIIALASSGFLGETFGWKATCGLWAVLNLAAVVSGLVLARNADIGRRTIARPRQTSARETLSKIGLLTFPIATGGALYQVTSYYGPINLTTMHGWTAGTADLIFAVWIGVGTVTAYYFGQLSRRWGRDRLLKAGYGISAVSAAALFFVSDWYIVAAVLVLYGSVLFLTYPAIFAAITKSTDESERGTAFGILFGFQLGGGAVVVYLCGLVADRLSDPSYSFLIVSALSLASLLFIQFGKTRT